VKEWHKLLLILGIFLAAYWMPLDHAGFQNALMEAFWMVQEYAREHILTCLIPAFFIAGAIASFLSKESVMHYLGPQANRWISYSVASVSGTILAVCSCTVLPLFAGIYKRGAGIGPASAFLYSGPAINILAIVLTARVLGPELGLARAVGAVLFSILIGLTMEVLFRREKPGGGEGGFVRMEAPAPRRPGWQSLLFFVAMVMVLIFAAWGKPSESVGFFNYVHSVHWWLAGLSLVLVLYSSFRWYSGEERKEWIGETWTFMKLILPLLFLGVLAAGFLLGRPESNAGILPMEWVQKLVGGNGLGANLFASVAGAFMYFATLTEVPILQGLMGAGMGKGPALALLLAGPALSLPNMLVIRSIMGTKKTVVYLLIVVVMSTMAGIVYGSIF